MVKGPTQMTGKLRKVWLWEWNGDKHAGGCPTVWLEDPDIPEGHNVNDYSRNEGYFLTEEELRECFEGAREMGRRVVISLTNSDGSSEEGLGTDYMRTKYETFYDWLKQRTEG